MEELFKVYDINNQEMLIDEPMTKEQIKKELSVIYHYEEDFSEDMLDNLEEFIANAELQRVIC